jgi:hypothetical protein
VKCDYSDPCDAFMKKTDYKEGSKETFSDCDKSY